MNPIFNAAVIGDPIEHSLSPAIFQWLSQSLNSPVSYQKLRISSQEWDDQSGVYSVLTALEGWNVTLPLKKKVISALDHLSEEASVLGAVNVVHRLKDQTLKGYNTDVLGIARTLVEHEVSSQGQVGLIFGAGGAALAAAYALGQLNAGAVWIWNRSPAHATDLIERVRLVFPKTQFRNVSQSLNLRGEEQPSLYINATPIGMKGYPRVFDLCKVMNSKAFAFDLVYSPQITPFLEVAQRQGLSFVGGLDMLVWQALATWEIWFGPLEHQSSLKSNLMQHLRESWATSMRR